MGRSQSGESEQWEPVFLTMELSGRDRLDASHNISPFDHIMGH